MYHTSVPNYNQAEGHNHSLQISEIPSHVHSMARSAMTGSSTGLVLEKDDFVIDISKGVMVNMQPSDNEITDDNIFLNNMCDCIVSRFTAHDINLFKAGNSNELKEKILNFLKKEKNKNE